MKVDSVKIAKNTMMLYVRFMLTVIVNLYVSRVVLNQLGAADFGIFDVVGGIVTMLTFISGSMTTATLKFFSVEIGKNDRDGLQKTFQSTLVIYILMSALIFIIAETAGLWYLNYEMNIPEGRMVAANWVYQFAVLNFVATVMTVPFSTLVIAHEKMGIYALFTIIASLLRISFLLILVYAFTDKLVLYSGLEFMVFFSTFLLYVIYCSRTYKDIAFKVKLNKEYFSEMWSHSNWNMLGSLSFALNAHGVNIMLNQFFANTAINAARGLAFKVNLSILAFADNFYTAVRPQIIKLFAQNAIEEMNKLIFQSSKFAFLLMLVLAMPILIETELLVDLWLKQPPEHTVIFIRLVIINSLIDVLNNPLVTAVHASGRVKFYLVRVTVFLLLNLPISYVVLTLGFPPESTMIVSIVISALAFIPRLWVCHKIAHLPVLKYLSQVLARVWSVSFLSFAIPVFLHFNIDNAFIRVVAVCMTSVVVSVSLMYLIGLNREEKSKLIQLIKEKLLSKFMSRYKQ